MARKRRAPLHLQEIDGKTVRAAAQRPAPAHTEKPTASQKDPAPSGFRETPRPLPDVEQVASHRRPAVPEKTNRTGKRTAARPAPEKDAEKTGRRPYRDLPSRSRLAPPPDATARTPAEAHTAAEKATTPSGFRSRFAAFFAVRRTPPQHEKASGEPEADYALTEDDVPLVAPPLFRIRGDHLWEDLRAYLHQWHLYLRHRRLSLNFDRELLYRGLIVAALAVFLAMLQTTIAARFPLFGRTPDLMMSFVIAVAMSEGDKWGGVSGLVVGLMIDALGAPGLPLSPLLYMPLGWTVGALTHNYFTGSVPVRVMYTLVAGIPRMLLTAIRLGAEEVSVPIGYALGKILLPEYASTAVLALVPHVLVFLCLRSFHRPRADRVV